MRVAKRFRFLPRAYFAEHVRVQTQFAQKVHRPHDSSARVRVCRLLCSTSHIQNSSSSRLVLYLRRRGHGRPPMGFFTYCVLRCACACSNSIRAKSAPATRLKCESACVSPPVRYAAHSELTELEACIVLAAARTWSATHVVLIASEVQRSCCGVV